MLSELAMALQIPALLGPATPAGAQALEDADLVHFCTFSCLV